MDPQNNNSFGLGGKPLGVPFGSDAQMNMGVGGLNGQNVDTSLPVANNMGQPVSGPIMGGSAMGGRPIGMPMATSGDVVFSSSNNTTSGGKKWLAVLLIILVAVAAGCGIGWWFLWGPGSNGNNGSVTSQTSADRAAFNEYANYLVLGEANLASDVDLETILKDYSVYNPEEVFAETASFADLKKINEKYEKLREITDWDSEGVAQKYYYYYLGCQKGDLVTAICAEKLGGDYVGLFGPFKDKDAEFDAFLKGVELRRAAMMVIGDEYAKVYDLGIKEEQ